MVKKIKSSFNIHSYKKTCNIKTTTNDNYVRNYEENNVGKTVFNLFEIALDKMFV